MRRKDTDASGLKAKVLTLIALHINYLWAIFQRVRQSIIFAAIVPV